MQTKIHTYTFDEPMLKVNAYIVETENQLIVVDTTLTMSDSKALKMKADNLNKPIQVLSSHMGIRIILQVLITFHRMF